MTDLSRRVLFRAAGAATALPGAAAAQARPPTEAPRPHEYSHAHRAPSAARAAAAPQAPLPFRFFNPAEAAFVEAAVDRLIPADNQWPGAVWAGVPHYIDQQLAGAYGQGARFYASGPWQKGLPSQGYQLPLNPAQLYRVSLGAIAQELQRRRLDFAKAPPQRKDAFLRELEDGKIQLAGNPSSEFFETLLANTIEGFLSDPSYGGNRDMVGWRMIGFPGAYGAYLGLYTNHGMRFEREPMSIATRGQAHDHGHAHDQGAQRRG